MSVLEDCTVYYKDGNVTRGTNVLFKDSGWVRVGVDGSYTYYPRENIERIEYDR